MSLLLLLGGAQVQGDDRTFTATWEQAVAGWEAVAIGPAVAEDTGRPLTRLEPFVQVYGRFIQEPPSWKAIVDVNDDEITLIELDAL